MIIRVHENRAKFDWGGWLQWKPSGTKTWYMMHRGAIVPLEMRDRFQECIDEMLSYQVAYEVRGEWNKEEKKMLIESIVGPIG